jgi:putative oxidoreductase
MDQLDKFKPHVLGLFRIVVGLLFACHGASTLFGFPIKPFGGSAPDFGSWPGWWAAAIQLVGGVLVLLGLGTRGAATICSGSMAFAYFTEHQPHDLFPIQNGGEPAAMFCWAFLLLMFFGPGSFALGTVVARLRGSEAPVPASAAHG